MFEPASNNPASYPIGCSLSASSAAPTPVSAGTISLSDGTTALANLTFNAMTPGYGPLDNTGAPALTWLAGDALQAAGDGDTVTPLDGIVLAPALLKEVTPQGLAGSSSVTIPVSSDFVVTWTPGQANVISLSLTSGSPPATVICNATDTGALTVPATLLANLPTGNGSVSLSRVNIQKGAAANAVVSVVAEAVILGSVVIHP